MEELKTVQCAVCREDSPLATREEIAAWQSQIPEWRILDVEGVPRLQREYSLPDFQAALDFANSIGAIAETENHHPKITIEWGKVSIAWWTHTIKNIHRNDFIMAAKTDEIFQAKS